MMIEDNFRKVVPYVPGEQPKDNDVIKLNTNENPYPPSPSVLTMYLQCVSCHSLIVVRKFYFRM